MIDAVKLVCGLALVAIGAAGHQGKRTRWFYGLVCVSVLPLSNRHRDYRLKCRSLLYGAVSGLIQDHPS